MKNAYVLRMAMALLTPAEESASEDTSADDTVTDDGSGSDDGSASGPGNIPGATPTMLSLTDGATSTAVTTTVKVAVNDPMVVDRLRILLDTAVGMLYGKALLSYRTLPRPSYPLRADEEFPLPDALASVAACYAAWLFTGEERLKLAWQGGLDGYLSTLEAVIEPIGKRR